MFLPALFPVGQGETVCACMCGYTSMCMCLSWKSERRVIPLDGANFPPAPTHAKLYFPPDIPFTLNDLQLWTGFVAGTRMTCRNGINTCEFVSKHKTPNYCKRLCKKRLRRIHSPVVATKETVPCDVLADTSWKLSRKRHCSVGQLQHSENCPRVKSCCNHDRQCKSENRKSYQASCNKCFPYNFLGYI